MGRKLTTSRGFEIEVQAIATLLDKFQAAHKPPTPPTYTVETAGKISETHEHDETTLQTEADKIAWGEYQIALTAHQVKYNRDLMRLILAKGITVHTQPSATWEQEQAFIGLSVPSDALEKRLYWIETEVLGGASDYQAILLGVLAESGVDENLLTQVEATFRGNAQRDAIGTVADSRGQVANIAEI